MQIEKINSIKKDWDKVKSFNYKLPHLNPPKSVVYAEIEGEHGEVTTRDSEWIYYIIEGSGIFTIAGKDFEVNSGDVVTIPANTSYNYKALGNGKLKVVMFIDLWDN